MLLTASSILSFFGLFVPLSAQVFFLVVFLLIPSVSLSSTNTFVEEADVCFTHGDKIFTSESLKAAFKYSK